MSVIPRPAVESILGRRTKYLPNYGYKLDAAGSRFGIDTPFTADPMDIDEANMAVWIPFASGERRDGVGDLLEVGGIDTSRHVHNPIVLFDHGKTVSLPVGLAEEPGTKNYMVSIDVMNRTARAKAYFYQGKGEITTLTGEPDYDHALFCEQLFDLIVKRYVRAGSIGYQVKKAVQLPPDYMTGTPQGLHLIQTLLLEVSAVVMPANADTVRKAMDLPRVAGKPLSPVLVKSLAPYASPKKAQMGYEQKAPSKEGTDAAKRRYEQLMQSGNHPIDRVMDAVARAGRIATSNVYHGEDIAEFYNDGMPLEGIDPTVQQRRRLHTAQRHTTDHIRTPGVIHGDVEPAPLYERDEYGDPVGEPLDESPEQKSVKYRQKARKEGMDVGAAVYRSEIASGAGERAARDVAVDQSDEVVRRQHGGHSSMQDMRDTDRSLNNRNVVPQRKSQPSDDISPEKARQMLHDGTAHGRPLTDDQRGMLGAAAGRGNKSQDSEEPELYFDAEPYESHLEYAVGDGVDFDVRRGSPQRARNDLAAIRENNVVEVDPMSIDYLNALDPAALQQFRRDRDAARETQQQFRDVPQVPEPVYELDDGGDNPRTVARGNKPYGSEQSGKGIKSVRRKYRPSPEEGKLDEVMKALGRAKATQDWHFKAADDFDVDLENGYADDQPTNNILRPKPASGFDDIPYQNEQPRMATQRYQQRYAPFTAPQPYNARPNYEEPSRKLPPNPDSEEAKVSDQEVEQQMEGWRNSTARLLGDFNEDEFNNLPHSVVARSRNDGTGGINAAPSQGSESMSGGGHYPEDRYNEKSVRPNKQEAQDAADDPNDLQSVNDAADLIDIDEYEGRSFSNTENMSAEEKAFWYGTKAGPRREDQGALGGIDRAVNAAAGKLSNAGGYVRDKINKVGEGVRKWGEGVDQRGNQAIEAVRQAGRKVGGAVGSAASAARKVPRKLAEGATNTVEKVGRAIGNNLTAQRLWSSDSAGREIQPEHTYNIREPDFGWLGGAEDKENVADWWAQEEENKPSAKVESAGTTSKAPRTDQQVDAANSKLKTDLRGLGLGHTADRAGADKQSAKLGASPMQNAEPYKMSDDPNDANYVPSVWDQPDEDTGELPDSYGLVTGSGVVQEVRRPATHPKKSIGSVRNKYRGR